MGDDHVYREVSAASDTVVYGVSLWEARHGPEKNQSMKQIWTDHTNGGGNLTHKGAILVIELLLPGRIKTDAFNEFWSCCPSDNLWSTDDLRWQRMLRHLREELGKWCERGDALKKYFAPEPDYYDRKLHKKMDKTLQSGMLAFRNGKLLDLSNLDRCKVRDLKPTDFVSISGTICWNLPDKEEFLAQWNESQMCNDSQMYESSQLYESEWDYLLKKIQKNFSDTASMQQVSKRIVWAILHSSSPLPRRTITDFWRAAAEDPHQ